MWSDREADERRIEVEQMSENGTAALKHPEAAGLHAMWSALRGGRPAPFRAELDAGKIGSKAPFLAIFEHVGPSNFRIRIAGDRLNRWFGLELRGMSALSMVAGPTRNHVQAALNRVVAEPAVAVLEGAARAADGQSTAFEMVFLPMRSDFGRIDRVLTGLWLIDPPAAVPCPFLLDVERVRVLDVATEVVSPREVVAAHVTRSIIERLGEAADAAPLAESQREPSAADQPTAAPAAGLRAIDGAGERTGEVRRGHLRLVKD